MNEQLLKFLNPLISNIDSRKQSEKILILGILIAGIVMTYLTLAFDPKRAQIASLQSQIASLENSISRQQTAYQTMLAQSQEDPNRFANDRLAVISREQAELDGEIQALAGDLVTPNQMTQLLRTVLERQSGLDLVSFRNVDAQPLREASTNAAELLEEDGAINFEDVSREEVVGQVYSHGLVIEFEGDYFSTLNYLRFLEDVTGSFFWDAISFSQLEWPNARVTLEIHTLSTDQGFIGV